MGRNPLGTPPRWAAQPHPRADAPLAGDAGYTFVELVLAVVIGLIVIGGTASFMVTSLRSANAASSRTIAARQAELFLARLTHEVREAQRIETVNSKNNKSENKTPVNVIYTATSTSVSFYLPNPGSSAAGTEVTWSCTKAAAKCTRSVAGGSAVTELTGVESATFNPYSAGAAIAASPEYPASIQLTLSVKDISQLDSEHTHVVTGVTNPITVQDGVSLRNYST